MFVEAAISVLLDFIVNSWHKVDFSIFKQKIVAAGNYLSKKGVNVWGALKSKFKKSGNEKMYTIIALLEAGKIEEAEAAFNDMKDEAKKETKNAK